MKWCKCSMLIQLFGAAMLCVQGFSGSAGPLDHWTLKHRSLPNSWTRVAYVGGQFIAIGDGGSIATSPDGSVWTARDSGVVYSLNGIAYGNGTFVIAGNGGLLRSPDGIQWRQSNPVNEPNGVIQTRKGQEQEP